jgi:hypothetical protein
MVKVKAHFVQNVRFLAFLVPFKHQKQGTASEEAVPANNNCLDYQYTTTAVPTLQISKISPAASMGVLMHP